MKLFFSDVLVICLIAAPNLLVELLSRRLRSRWLKKYEATVHLVLLFVTLFSVYVFLFPRLGFEPNQQFR
jgi:hypothetical protein